MTLVPWLAMVCCSLLIWLKCQMGPLKRYLHEVGMLAARTNTPPPIDPQLLSSLQTVVHLTIFALTLCVALILVITMHKQRWPLVGRLAAFLFVAFSLFISMLVP